MWALVRCVQMLMFHDEMRYIGNALKLADMLEGRL